MIVDTHLIESSRYRGELQTCVMKRKDEPKSLDNIHSRKSWKDRSSLYNRDIVDIGSIERVRNYIVEMLLCSI